MSRNRPFVAAVVAGLFLVAGCTAPDGATDWTKFNTETVTLALEAVAAAGSLYVAQYEASGPDAACAAAVAYLDGREGVLSCGIAPDSSVWVQFRNDFAASVVEETFGRQGAARRGPAVPVRSQGGGEAMGSTGVLAPFAWQLAGTDPEQVVAYLDTCMDPGLEPVVLTDAEVLVGTVRQILEAGAGTLFWAGHGTMAPVDTEIGLYVCALLTGESYATKGEMAEELVTKYAGKVGPESDYLYTVRMKDRFWLAIMPGFVTAHGNFDWMEGMPVNQTKSLVYVSCCFSDLGMSAAFLDAGVDVYWGWSWAVDDSFAGALDAEMFRLLCDTCTAGEATRDLYDRCSLLCPYTCRKGKARLIMYGDSTVMVKAQVRVAVDGASQRCYGVGATEGSSFYMVSSGYGPDLRYGVGVEFPGAGTWDCTADEEAAIFWWDDDNPDDGYSVAAGYVGVSGTIAVSACDANRTFGTFSGTLGHWEEGHNPLRDPPDATKTLEHGFFKHTGRRF